MGCPIDLVCDKGMGAALMGRTRKLRGIIAVSTQHKTAVYNSMSQHLTLHSLGGYVV